MATQYVLTMGSLVSCGHSPGKVDVSNDAKLKVNGNPVLLAGGISSKTVTGCSTLAASDNSGPTDITCTHVLAVTAGQAIKLKVGGEPVMLETLAGTTDGMVTKVTPQNLLQGRAVQAKLKTI